MQGRRRDDIQQEQIVPDEVQPGDYWRTSDGTWWIKPPTGAAPARISNHSVVEHEDGTITATPSILITWGTGQWHGYLTKGEWIEC